MSDDFYLSAESYERIRALYAAGHSMTAVARMLGVHQTTVSRIIRGKTKPVRHGRRKVTRKKTTGAN